MKLTTQEPRVFVDLNDLNQRVICRFSGNAQSGFGQFVEVLVVEFVSMTVTFNDFIPVVDFTCQCICYLKTPATTETHGTTQIRIFIADFDRAILAHPFCNQRNHRIRRCIAEFGTVGAF